jgi:hypothetical protein
VVPDTHDPSGEAGAATACTSTRQVCLWSNRNRPDIQDPGLLPQTSSELLAHESAHLLFPHGGPPDFDGWRAAIDADRPNHYGYRYVDDAIECYAVDQHEREDWANAVAMLHESVRDDEATWMSSASVLRDSATATPIAPGSSIGFSQLRVKVLHLPRWSTRPSVVGSGPTRAHNGTTDHAQTRIPPWHPTSNGVTPSCTR